MKRPTLLQSLEWKVVHQVFRNSTFTEHELETLNTSVLRYTVETTISVCYQERRE